MVHIAIVMLVYARFALFPLKSVFIYCGRARLYQKAYAENWRSFAFLYQNISILHRIIFGELQPLSVQRTVASACQ